MKYRHIVLFATALTFCSSRYHSQNSISFGASAGLGAAVLKPHPEFESNGIQYNVQTNPYYRTGAACQYMISNFAGLETGFQFIYHSYSIKNGQTYLKNYLSEPAAIKVIDYQIPLLFIYNIRRNPSRYYKFLAGTSLDWLTTHASTKWGSLLSMENLVLGVRMGRGNLKYGKKYSKYGKIEYSLEHQYSFNRYTLRGVSYNQLQNTINSRFSMLTFSVYYVFYTKQMS